MSGLHTTAALMCVRRAVFQPPLYGIKYAYEQLTQAQLVTGNALSTYSFPIHSTVKVSSKLQTLSLFLSIAPAFKSHTFLHENCCKHLALTYDTATTST